MSIYTKLSYFILNTESVLFFQYILYNVDYIWSVPSHALYARRLEPLKKAIEWMTKIYFPKDKPSTCVWDKINTWNISLKVTSSQFCFSYTFLSVLGCQNLYAELFYVSLYWVSNLLPTNFFILILC